ncbi:hypothetical protein B0H14DRAFT_2640219 [Mycena olivaceomarginata]|nr:hypothetical protein B0H14DRAFT_2640219 [Mycena olivaceomarginata]
MRSSHSSSPSSAYAVGFHRRHCEDGFACPHMRKFVEGPGSLRRVDDAEEGGGRVSIIRGASPLPPAPAPPPAAAGPPDPSVPPLNILTVKLFMKYCLYQLNNLAPRDDSAIVALVQGRLSVKQSEEQREIEVGGMSPSHLSRQNRMRATIRETWRQRLVGISPNSDEEVGAGVSDLLLAQEMIDGVLSDDPGRRLGAAAGFRGFLSGGWVRRLNPSLGAASFLVSSGFCGRAALCFGNAKYEPPHCILNPENIAPRMGSFFYLPAFPHLDQPILNIQNGPLPVGWQSGKHLGSIPHIKLRLPPNSQLKHQIIEPPGIFLPHPEKSR